jgi:hypothetical protein
MRYFVSAVAALAAVTVAGNAPAKGPGSGSRAAAPPPLSTIAFMTGCWRGPSSTGATIEEQYSEPTDNLVIGMTRYVRGGRVVDFEFTTIERTDSTFVMTPRPKGVKSDPFALKEVTDDRAVWENPKHDFPQRIIYRKSPDGGLIARIEGTTPRGDRHQEWTMRRCS